MSSSLSGDAVDDLLERARQIAARNGERYPGDRPERQPLHTLYVPADRFSERTTVEAGAEALRLLETHASDAASFEAVFGIDAAVASLTHERVKDKLGREPVEDVRVDFEDGYGGRPDHEEDAHASAAAVACANARQVGTLPDSFGVRVKSFADGREGRSVRTLDVFLTTLLEHSGAFPDGFVVTFPKIVAWEHVVVFVEVLERLERALGLHQGALRFEVQVETPQSVVDHGGTVAARRIVQAAGARLASMHFGVYDYTASLGLMPWEQRLDHPANDFARRAVQAALAGSGVWISDGSTNVIPASDRPEDVHAVWRLHAAHVRHSLEAGYHQGWDLHPSHLVSRFASVYGWLLPHLDDAVARIRSWREQTATSGVLDEPATASSLLRYLRFAISSGAVDEIDVLTGSGLAHEELFVSGQVR